MELKIHEQWQKINVEELISRLKGRRTITPLFRVPLSFEETCELLYIFYRTEVEIRRRDFIEDDATRSNIMQISHHLTSQSNKLGIMLCGACGNGKTTYMLAIQNMINWLRDFKRCFEQPEYAAMQIKKSKEITAMAREDSKSFMDFVKYPKILAIDDFGEEPKEVMNYGNIKAPVIDLIETRYDHQLPIYLTSNKSPETITKEYGDRIGDRLSEMVDIIVFDRTIKQSYRKI